MRIAGERHAYCCGHDEGEARVPGAREVEEVLDLRRVRHAGDDEAEAEQHSGGEGSPTVRKCFAFAFMAGASRRRR